MRDFATIWVTPGGTARLEDPWPSDRGARAAEAARLAAVRARGRLPEACTAQGTGMVDMAPARGPMVPVRHHVIADHGQGPRVEDTGYRGRAAARRLDALDRIASLSEAQRAAGRRYAALTEVVAAGGIRCSADLAGSCGSDGDGDRDWMDHHLARSERLRRMHRAIGDGIGMTVRRVRPSARGTRTSIPDRRLADLVCLGQSGLVPVLEAHGWIKTGRNVRVLSEALAAILERLRDV